MTDQRKYTVQSLNMTEKERIEFINAHMHENKCYQSLPAKGKTPENLNRLKEKYTTYRQNWRKLPEKAIDQARQTGNLKKLSYSPLCVDIETASICDLACPFCYRQHIATPDRIMKKDLFQRIIDQCVQMDVPSIKLNWRGEPLMNPALPEFIAYAKEKGILEVMINTNAVELDEKKGKALIEAGIDGVIFSFDGGTAKTYNQMRPGRFKSNQFDTVYNNIKTFAKTKAKLNKVFPVTRIQMIITKETSQEVESFFKLFKPYVDDVSTKAYSERGGNIEQMDPRIVQAVKQHLDLKFDEKQNVDTQRIWISSDDKVAYALSRLACQQIFQRLVVTYNGRVFMCCYDWGCTHTIGYLTQQAFEGETHDIEQVMDNSAKRKRGYESMPNLTVLPSSYEAEKKVSSLYDIWHSNHLQDIRKLHIDRQLDRIPLCKNCNFRDTYTWENIPC